MCAEYQPKVERREVYRVPSRQSLYRLYVGGRSVGRVFYVHSKDLWIRRLRVMKIPLLHALTHQYTHMRTHAHIHKCTRTHICTTSKLPSLPPSLPLSLPRTLRPSGGREKGKGWRGVREGGREGRREGGREGGFLSLSFPSPQNGMGAEQVLYSSFKYKYTCK